MTPTVHSIKSAQMRLVSSEESKYEISALVTKTEYTSNVMSDGTNGNVQNGVVSLEGKQVAVFYSPNEGNLNVNYFISEKEIRADILAEIEDFVTSAREFVNNAVINVTQKD